MPSNVLHFMLGWSKSGPVFHSLSIKILKNCQLCHDISAFTCGEALIIKSWNFKGGKSKQQVKIAYH